MGYKSNTLAFLGGRRNQELPEGKTFLNFFYFFIFFWKSSFFVCFTVAHTDAGEHLCRLRKLIQQVADRARCFLQVTATTVCRCFLFFFNACLSTGPHVRGVGVQVLGALGNSPRTCRSWCLLTEKHRTENAGEVFLRNSKMQLVEAHLILLLLLKADMFCFTSRPQNAPDYFFPDPQWWHQYAREGILSFPLGQGTNPGSAVMTQEYFLQGPSSQ